MVCTRTMALLLLMAAIPGHAATQQASAAITRTLAADDDRYGGCMVALDIDLRGDLGLDCNSNWVTFSCAGVHTDSTTAQRMLDSALVAFVTDRMVRVWVTDEKKHDGHCYATRIDVLRTSVSAN